MIEVEGRRPAISLSQHPRDNLKQPADVQAVSELHVAALGNSCVQPTMYQDQTNEDCALPPRWMLESAVDREPHHN